MPANTPRLAVDPVEVALNGVLALDRPDQLVVFGRLAEAIADTSVSKPPTAVVAAQRVSDAIECLRLAAEHDGLLPHGAPTKARYDAIRKDFGLALSGKQIQTAFKDRWGDAKAAVTNAWQVELEPIEGGRHAHRSTTDEDMLDGSVAGYRRPEREADRGRLPGLAQDLGAAAAGK